MKEIFNGHSCVLYLITDNEMDDQEKIKEFSRRFPKGKNINDELIEEEHTEKYKILKFIGVDDSYTDEKNQEFSLWSFDYKGRPNKYIVFEQIKNTKPIPGEGVTGMTARLKKIFYYKGEKLENLPARYEDNDTALNIHPKCIEVLSIPIVEDKKCLGVIRLDIYDGLNKNQKFEIKNIGSKSNYDFKKFIKENTSSNMYFTMNEICKKIIHISTKNAKTLSYSALFKGEKIIDGIKSIKEAVEIQNNDINKELYDLIEHLFFVFKRNTYIGYNEIMQRVLYFIYDLFDLLKLGNYYEQMKELNKLTLESPILDDIKLDDKNITCSLKYLTGLRPSEKKLAGYFSEKIAKFSSSSFNFYVNYTYQTGKQSDSYKF